MNEFITMRGAIAHRGSMPSSCHKVDVLNYFDFVKKLVGRTGLVVNNHVRKITGSGLYRRVRKKIA